VLFYRIKRIIGAKSKTNELLREEQMF